METLQATAACLSITSQTLQDLIQMKDNIKRYTKDTEKKMTITCRLEQISPRVSGHSTLLTEGNTLYGPIILLQYVFFYTN